MFRLIFCLIGLTFSTSACQQSAELRLSQIDAELQKSYSEIDHISADSLAQWMAQNRNLVILDVREEDEFSVGHIDGAIRISPNASDDDVLAMVNDDIADKDVIFYCSVGVRSSQLAKRSMQLLQDSGAKSISNLSEGIFKWHNDKRLLKDAAGETLLVHPYNKTWGKLLARQDYVSNTPNNIP